MAKIPDVKLARQDEVNSHNKLILGDNLSVMKALFSSLLGKIDLVYIDPPFATNNVFLMDDDRANTISRNLNSRMAYSDTLAGAEYLEFIRQRLILLRELMSEKGSMYLHIDYKIGHYVKILMDEVFGVKNFRNDISRIKCNPKNFKRRAFGNIKDMVLLYSKTDSYIWNEPHENYSDADAKKLYPKIDAQGRRYTTIPLHAPGETINGASGEKFKGISPPKGRHWRSSPEELEKLDQQNLIEWSATGVPRRKIYLDSMPGKRMQDIWEFKDPQYPVYPTEKNLKMLELIIRTSSLPESRVLDCFCGSGSTLVAANNTDRNWIGIDSSKEAILVAQEKLQKESILGIKDYEFLIAVDGRNDEQLICKPASSKWKSVIGH